MKTECRICSSTTQPFFVPMVQKRYQLCQSCEFISLDKEHWLYASDEKSIYDLHQNSPKNSGYVAMFERFLAKLDQLRIGSIQTALDFGCGPGPILAQLLTKRNIKVDIFDPFYFPKPIFSGKKYDLVVSTEVFEHLKNPLIEMRLIADCLAAGGYLAIQTELLTGDKEFSQWWYIREPVHISFYTLKTFQTICALIGFHLVYSDAKNCIVLCKNC